MEVELTREVEQQQAQGKAGLRRKVWIRRRRGYLLSGKI